MDPLTPLLSDEEFVALKEVAKRHGQKVIAPVARNRLMALGLICQKLGGLQLTPEGETRVGLGR